VNVIKAVHKEIIRIACSSFSLIEDDFQVLFNQQADQYLSSMSFRSNDNRHHCHNQMCECLIRACPLDQDLL